MTIQKCVIIGSGCAGLTAAIYTARANLKPLVLEGPTPGGQLMLTSDVENFPGFPNGISGFELLDSMKNQAAKFGAQFLSDEVQSIEIDKEISEGKNEKFPILKITFKSGEVKHSETVIVATGAAARYLGVPGEKELYGKGVTACATCDAFFYRGKEVAVVGGGDTAVEEATYLTNFASKVYLIHRRDTLRASKFMQNKLFSMKDKVEPIWDTVIEEVIQKDEKDKKKFGGLNLKNVKTGKKSHLNVSGLFLAVGHIPATKFLNGFMDLDKQGYIVTEQDSNVRTKIPTVFACGDCVDREYRQAISSAGMGCQAGMEATKVFQFKE